MRKTRTLSKVIVTFLTSILLFFSPNTASGIEGGQSFKDNVFSTLKKTVLPNGMKIIHLERHDLPIVSINLLIRAGSRHESPQKAGLANLVAEMLLEGTKTMDASQISETIEFTGASLITETDYDYTIISLYTLKKDLLETFKVFKEIVLNPVFPEKGLKRNKSIILTNLQKAEQEPSYAGMKALREKIFKDHPYSRPVEGLIETVKKISRRDLIDFYNNHYIPAGAILVIAGDLREEELSLLLSEFKNWKTQLLLSPPTRIKQLSTTDLASQTIIVDRDLTQANIFYGFRGISRKDPDYYTASVMNYILGGGGFGSRLLKKIREEMGLAYDVSSYFTINEEPGLFIVSLQTKNDQAFKAIEIIKQEIQRLTEEPISDEELQEAKAYLTGSLVRRLDTTQKLANFLTLAEFYELGDDYIKRYPEYINNVTKDDIIKFANMLFSQEGVMVIVGKQSELK